MKVTFTRYNSASGIDVPRSAEVLRVEEYPDYASITYHLGNGKVIFVEPRRSELWGKSGYLGIVENVKVEE
jgi:hypothetical protein